MRAIAGSTDAQKSAESTPPQLVTRRGITTGFRLTQVPVPREMYQVSTTFPTSTTFPEMRDLGSERVIRCPQIAGPQVGWGGGVSFFGWPNEIYS